MDKEKTRGQNQIFDFALRYSNKKYSLEDFKNLNEPFEEFLKDFGEKYIFQLEYTENNPHFQGFINLKERKRLNTFRKEWNDYEIEDEEGNIYTFEGCEIQPASTQGKRALKDYCMKPETRVAGPWADCHIYMGEDLPTKLLQWQQHILDEIQKPVCDRTINWLVDKKGNMGKSKFCKFVNFYKYGTKLTYGNTKDLLFLVSKYQNEDAYIFDLTRTKSVDFSTNDLYATIEEIKNGDFINFKYECEKVIMRVPHIWVYSNHPPKMDSLTADRWKIWTFTETDLEPNKASKDDWNQYRETANIIPYKYNGNTITNNCTSSFLNCDDDDEE